MFSNISNSKKSIIYGIKNTIESYQKIGVEIIFINQVPEQIYEPDYVYRKSFNKLIKEIDIKEIEKFSLDFKKHISHQKFIRKELDNLDLKYSNFKKIDFDDVFCNNLKCLYGTELHSSYSDKNHLSIFGAQKTINRIMRLIN